MASIVKYLVTPIPSWLVGNGVFWPMAKSTFLTESLLRLANPQSDCDQPEFRAVPDEFWG
jgi:hypothetical protein